jgi:ArsR family transcriptional regulator
MTTALAMEFRDFEANALEVANVLRALGNERRLMILCKLAEAGEMTVGALVEGVGLSQSALSQHLAKMRDDNVVTFRRDSQTLWYRIADPRIEQLMTELHRLFCRVTPATLTRPNKEFDHVTSPYLPRQGESTDRSRRSACRHQGVR